MNNEPRVRINAKQTSKGEWYLDITIETNEVLKSAHMVTQAIKEAEIRFKRDGRVLVSKPESKGGEENPKL